MWAQLRIDIAAIIKSNGIGAITGPVLQDVLNNLMVANLGKPQYKGMATPSTLPDVEDGPSWYMAIEAGTYTNFGGTVTAGGVLMAFTWDGAAWSMEVVMDLTEFGWDLLMGNNQIKELADGTEDDDAATVKQARDMPVDIADKRIYETGQAGEALVSGEIVYLKSDGKYWKADKATTGQAELRLVEEDMAADEVGTFLIAGRFTTTGLTAGVVYYLGAAGAITAIRPTTDGEIVRYIGTAKSTTVLLVNIGGANEIIATAGGGYTLPLASATRGGIKAADKGAGDTVEVKIDSTTEKLFVPTYPTVPSKATGAEINTGTDNNKFTTPKAIADSNVLQLGKDGQLGGLNEKTTPADDDKTMIEDSAESHKKKWISWTNIKATLKTYFDTLYNKYVHPNHSGDVTSSGDGAQTIAATAISGKASAGTLAGTEEVLLNAAGTLKKTTAQTIANLASGSGITEVVQDTTPELGGPLDANGKYIAFDPLLIASGQSYNRYNGLTMKGTIANGEAIEFGICVSFDSGSWEWIVARPLEGYWAQGIVSTDDNGEKQILIYGFIDVQGALYDVGKPIYCGEDGMPTTSPTYMRQQIGYTISNSTIFFNPQAYQDELNINRASETEPPTFRLIRTGEGDLNGSRWMPSGRFDFCRTWYHSSAPGDSGVDVMARLEAFEEHLYTSGFRIILRNNNIYGHNAVNGLEINGHVVRFGDVDPNEYPIASFAIARENYYYRFVFPDITADIRFPFPPNEPIIGGIMVGGTTGSPGQPSTAWMSLTDYFDAILGTEPGTVLYRGNDEWTTLGPDDGYLNCNTGVISWQTPSGSGSVLTAKGDIWTRSSSADYRLPVGTDGDVLTAASGETGGLKWNAPSWDKKMAGINEQTGTTYTLAVADAGKLVRCLNANAITVTVDPDSSVNIPTGSVITIEQQGAGQVTVAQGTGVTINKYGGLKTAGQYAAVQLVKVAADTWTLYGGVAA